MNTNSNIFCPPEAIEIAWKMRWKGYDSEAAAIRALRRKIKGINEEKGNEALEAATILLEEAISLLKRRLREIVNAGEDIPQGIEDYMHLFKENFEGYEKETKLKALGKAMLYHMR